MAEENATWLPNLVGGTSIWKLAVDLNEAKFFDGRLLVPETEGSESLPVTVRWDLTGLIPLAEAQSKYPDDTTKALGDFKDCLDRVGKVFSTPNSGFDKYKQAFTVPAVAAQGDNYFYSPDSKKLFVINWGASPRSMAGKAEFVFGYEDWGKVFKDKGGAGAAGAGLAAGAAVAAVAAGDAAKKDEKKDEKKEEKKKDDKAKPWWMWPLFALIAIALVLLALFLLKSCEEQKIAGQDAAADGEAGADAAGDAEAGADAMADAEAGADAMADANADAMADGGDAGADAMADAGKDGGKDGGADGGPASDDDDDDDDPESSSSGGASSSGGGGGPVVVTIGGAGTGGAKKGAHHRKHYAKEATKWRIAAGNEKVSRTEARGSRYDVWVAPGKTFDGVRVEWLGKDGKWHAH